jgi:hypothetical protein
MSGMNRLTHAEAGAQDAGFSAFIDTAGLHLDSHDGPVYNCRLGGCFDDPFYVALQ